LCWMSKHFWQRNRTGSCSVVLFTFLLIVLKVLESFVCIATLKCMMIVRENHQKGRKVTVATGSCCLYRRRGCICNLSFHKFLVLKNIPAKRANSRTWKRALLFAGKEVWCKGVLTAQGMWHTVFTVPDV
jgi:hypothetical protein